MYRNLLLKYKEDLTNHFICLKNLNIPQFLGFFFECKLLIKALKFHKFKINVQKGTKLF